VFTRLQLIDELLRTHDIEGLIEIGAPEDEYNSEAKMIAERIGAAEWRTHPQKLSVARIREIIRNVWAEMSVSTKKILGSARTLSRKLQNGWVFSRRAAAFALAQGVSPGQAINKYWSPFRGDTQVPSLKGLGIDLGSSPGAHAPG
jgi:hypothetical protein